MNLLSLVTTSTDRELWLRLGFFLIALLVLSILEILFPRRPLSIKKSYRWFNNLGMVVINSLLLRVVFPGATVGAALFAESNGWGLFHFLEIPFAISFILSLLILDFSIWAQHVVFHFIPPLWRLHRLHHADLDFDVTTGLRFHPVEILFSMLIKVFMIMLIGAPIVAVLCFEIVLNALSMFNHSNIRIPSMIDKILRAFIVTPDMHRIHHSWHPEETNSNFGFNLSFWDKLFKVYRAEPRDGHSKMTIGLHEFRERSELSLAKMLAQPFRQSSIFKKKGVTRSI